MTEQMVTIAGEGGALHGILRTPEAPTQRAVVICDPFAEEKKCAHRPLTDLARALCEAGLAVLRFDLRGCGDSDGDFAQATLEGWAADLRAALAFVRERLSPQWLALGGLRTGAALAERVALADGGADALLLWEPVMDGKRYITQNLRRSMIKAMLTEGEGFEAQAVSERHEAEVVDFDGYEVSRAMREGLEGVRMGEGANGFCGPVLVLNIGPREEPQEAYVDLAARYPAGTAVGVRTEPFWNRIGLIDAGAVAGATLEWLRTAGGAQ
jgi:exosortase A-associated hydrolase 2